MKLTMTQIAALEHFTPGGVACPAWKPKHSTYAALRNLGLIRETNEFPFHVTTDKGRFALAQARSDTYRYMLRVSGVWKLINDLCYEDMCHVARNLTLTKRPRSQWQIFPLIGGKA